MQGIDYVKEIFTGGTGSTGKEVKLVFGTAVARVCIFYNKHFTLLELARQTISIIVKYVVLRAALS